MVDLENFLNSIKSVSDPATARGSSTAAGSVKDADQGFAAIFKTTVAAVKPAQSGKLLPPTGNPGADHPLEIVNPRGLESRQLQSGLTVLVAGPEPSDQAITDFAAEQGIDLKALTGQPIEQIAVPTDKQQAHPLDDSGIQAFLTKQPTAAADLKPSPMSPLSTPLTVDRTPSTKQQHPSSPSITDAADNTHSLAPDDQSVENSSRGEVGQPTQPAKPTGYSSNISPPEAPRQEAGSTPAVQTTNAVLQARNRVATDQTLGSDAIPQRRRAQSATAMPSVATSSVDSATLQPSSAKSPSVQAPLTQAPLTQASLAAEKPRAEGVPDSSRESVEPSVDDLGLQPVDQARNTQLADQWPEVADNPRPASAAETTETGVMIQNARAAVQPPTASNTAQSPAPISAAAASESASRADKLTPPPNQFSADKSPPFVEPKVGVSKVSINLPKTEDGAPLVQSRTATAPAVNAARIGTHSKVSDAKTAHYSSTTVDSDGISPSGSRVGQLSQSAPLSPPAMKTEASLTNVANAATSGAQSKDGVATEPMPKQQPAATLWLGKPRGGLTKSSFSLMPAISAPVPMEPINLQPTQASAASSLASPSVNPASVALPSVSETPNPSTQPSIADGVERNPVQVVREIAPADSPLRQDQYSQMSRALSEALGQRIVAQLSRGEWRVEMQLHPTNLGRIEIHLEMRNGELEANFYTANQITKELINEGLPRLRHALEQQGMETANKGLEQGNQGKSNGNSTGQDNPKQQYVDTQLVESSPDRPTDGTTDDGLDILI